MSAASQSITAPYAELLRDLAHAEPRDGYTRDTLNLTATQVAAVVEHDSTIAGEACVDADEQIVASIKSYLVSENPSSVLLAGIGAAIVNAVYARAPGWIISDVLNACADAGEARRVDARFERDAVAA